jgi:hypothetical protein
MRRRAEPHSQNRNAAAPLVSTRAHSLTPHPESIRSTNMPFVPPGMMLDVDALVNDRAISTCGVSDVLSASPFGMEPAHAFLPRLSNSHPH